MVRIGITGIALIAALVVAGGSFGHISAAATGPAQIPISGQTTDFVRLNVGKKGRSAGDTEVGRQGPYNRRLSTRAIGHSSVMCTYAIGPERLCRGTYFLPKGSLIVAGSINAGELG